MHEEANDRLGLLDSLVAPLEAASKPGDLLVFCPTKILHSIPLHALAINETLLIERNPIMYAHSLSLLRYCFSIRHADSSRTTPKPWKTAAFCRPVTETGRSAVPELGRLLETQPFTGEDISKDRLIEALRDTSLLHFHGHCRPNGPDPLDQFLELNSLEQLTAREVFDLPRPANSYHATLLACQSGISRVLASDNALGFTTSFLHCGATSTVSTLWPIDDQDAVEFSKVFGEAVKEARMRVEGGRKVVDIARAVQRATLAILEVRGLPYHWAPFVGHGFWLLEV